MFLDRMSTNIIEVTCHIIMTYLVKKIKNKTGDIRELLIVVIVI